MKVGFNVCIRWSIVRVFLEPGATSFHTARWIILQDWKTNEEIKDMANDQNIFKNLSKLDEDSSGADEAQGDLYEEARNRLLNETANRSGNQKELWHCFDRIEGKMYTIANRTLVIREQENIYWHGKAPVVPFYVRPRAHSPWGDGLFERTERLGSANNAIINHFLDQLDLSVNGMVMRREDVIVDADVSPGGEIVWQGSEKPEQWEIPQPDSGGFAVARRVISEAIEENTISNYELGVPRSNTDQTQGTKGGILAIQEAAGDMLRFFELSFANSCQMWYQMWVSNNQQLLDREVGLRILGPNGWIPKTIRPEDIISQGTLDVVVDADDMRPRSKQDDRQIKLAWVDRQLGLAKVAMEMGQPLTLNFYEMSRVTADVMGITDFDRIVEPTPQSNDSPTSENQLMLQGKELEANLEEDHLTHISSHSELLTDPGVDMELKDDVVEPHIRMHEMFLEQVQAAEEEAKQAQEQEELASLVALRNETAAIAGGGFGSTGTPGGNSVPVPTQEVPPAFPGPQ